MKIYLVRHGESTLNAKNFHQDEYSPLSKKGISQAKEIAKRFKDIPINLFYASPFTRAKETAGIISQIVNKKIEFSPLITELKRPSSFVGKYFLSKDIVKIKKLITKNFENPNWRHSDKETFFEFRERTSEFLKKLRKINKEHVLVVTHGDFIRMFVALMIFGDEVEPKTFTKIRRSFNIGNTGITECEYKNSRWKLITWNDLSHIK